MDETQTQRAGRARARRGSAHGRSPPLKQSRLAVAMEGSLFVFYSRLLDYIVGRGEIRPQLYVIAAARYAAW